MRVLAVIPHYFGSSQPQNSSRTSGCYIEPLARIAALTETIVGLHRHVGPHWLPAIGTSFAEAVERPVSRLDIVILSRRDASLVEAFDFQPGIIEVLHVDCEPVRIPLQVPKVLRDRFGNYDFYCYIEEDLIIHDPAFFAKLMWFQEAFGPKALLAPTQYEMGSAGLPAKVIISPVLPESYVVPFRREGQRREIEAVWNGRPQHFSLPNNPHSACYFLTAEQLAYWMQQPSFDDEDDSWVGPVESAATLSVGKVFDIYKPTHPDPFFLELQHYGTAWASHRTSPGFRFGEPPLLAIAQNALRQAMGARSEVSSDEVEDALFLSLAKRWIAQGTAMEAFFRLPMVEQELAQRNEEAARLRSVNATQAAELRRLQSDIGALQTQVARLSNLRVYERIRSQAGAMLSRLRAKARRHLPRRTSR